MDKDLMLNPYGRFYYLAYYLSELGHDVELILYSYRRNENHKMSQGGLKLNSVSLAPNPVTAIFYVNQRVKEINPDWIMGFSDTYYGILAVYFSRKLKKKSLIDAYDNYEAYIPFLKPLHWLWRYSLKHADVLICAGPSLVNLFKNYNKKDHIHIVPMTVDNNDYREKDREQCRSQLGLSLNSKLVGYYGSIFTSRDISTLFSAFEKVKSRYSNIELVLAGRKEPGVKIPESVNYLGYLPEKDVSLFINSMDIVVVINRRSTFGNYSYPIKLYEAMACKIPVIVSKTESTKWIMNGNTDLLVEPENADLLATSILNNLDTDRIDYGHMPGWHDLAEQLSGLLN